MKTLKTSLNKKDFLSLKDLSKEEILSILDLSKGLKRDLKYGKLSQILKGITLAMIFQKPSTRTRLSFETGIVQLGGTAIYLSSTDLLILFILAKFWPISSQFKSTKKLSMD